MANSFNKCFEDVLNFGKPQQWAKEDLKSYNYDTELTPTITIETGLWYPHIIISNCQNMRRDTSV